ncbi:YceI family protein [Mesonia sp. MT50]|uniref:YceI family protein n=1 Tax=Mesonia profundi TaxID=3070998 RepID=A0ABU1A5A3_9FLAO|nr:YceI family protein [Mesonia profundi]MDQ7918129.1 YceI family protein [Mesonia profundi]
MRNLAVFILFIFQVGQATSQNFIADAASSKMSVSGTSSLHDWDCPADTFTGKLNANMENGKLQSITSFHFELKAESLKSGKSLMDKKMYNALKTDKNPRIIFKGDEVELNGDQVIFKGKMTIAGETRSIEAPVKINYKNEVLYVQGEKAFDLTSFKIDPPKAMLGTIKTGDEVVIHYNIQLNNQ